MNSYVLICMLGGVGFCVGYGRAIQIRSFFFSKFFLLFPVLLHCRLMVLKISSKFELRRFCRTTGAVAMVSLLRLCY